MTVKELEDLILREFPQNQIILESISSRSSRVRIRVNHSHLRPGGTVSGPTMMNLADMAMYLALLGEIGPVLLAVTTNLSINFVQKPESDKDVIGECSIFKLGKKLAVGEVRIFSEGIEEMVAHATCTYSIPKT
jgi:uncharacterized protein (TIGR00369 family)